MALPVDPRIEAILAGGRGIVSSANAGRQQLSILAALGLTDSGLLERASSQVAGQQSAGFAEAPDLMNTTYGIQQGPEGRQFRQAAGSIASAAAQRGASYGSATQNAQLLARRALLQQLAAQIRGFDTSQFNTLQQEGKDLSPLGSSIADIRWQQAQDAAAAPPPAPAAAQPTPAAGAPVPGPGKVGTVTSGAPRQRLGEPVYANKLRAYAAAQRPKTITLPTLVRR